MFGKFPVGRLRFRPSNYTLGVGNNHVDVHVVDVTHTEPWIINTYVLHIYRDSLAEKHIHTDPHSLKPCRLIQVCSTWEMWGTADINSYHYSRIKQKVMGLKKYDMLLANFQMDFVVQWTSYIIVRCTMIKKICLRYASFNWDTQSR